MAYSLRMVYFLHHENDSLQWMSFALKKQYGSDYGYTKHDVL